MKWVNMMRRHLICLGILENFAKDGYLNIVGGCCGSTPRSYKTDI